MLNKLISVYKFKGINNVEKSLRLSYARGNTFLKDALNLDIDNSGMIAKRKSIEKLFDGAFSSLWPDKDFVYGLKDGYVFRFDGDTLDLITAVTRTSVDFCSGADRVFFTGDTYMGSIVGTEVTYPDAEKATTYSKTREELMGKEFVSSNTETLSHVSKYGLPSGAFCASYLARLFVADYTQIAYSLPFDYLYMHPEAYMFMPSRITTMVGTPGFLFIGTKKGAYTITGEGKELRLRQLTSKKVLYNSACVIDPSTMDVSLNSPNVVLFSQPSGIFATQGETATKLTPQYRIGNSQCKGAFLKVTDNGDSFPIHQYCLNMEA